MPLSLRFRVWSAIVVAVTAACWPAAAAGADAAAATPEDKVARDVAALRALPMAEFGPRAFLFAHGLDAAELAQARALVFNALPSAQNDNLGAFLVQRWGELDGPAAFAFASALKSALKPQYQSRALLGWAKTDPRGAWYRLLIISNRGADDRYDENQLMFTIAEQDIAVALDLFQDLTSVRVCLVCSAKQIVYEALMQDRLELVTATIAKMAPGPTRNALRDGYWRTVGEFAVQRGLAELPTVSDFEDRKAAEVQLAAGWATRDFQAALEHVLAHYDRAGIGRAILPMIQEWKQGAGPEDVRAVVKKLPPTLSEQSLLGVVQAVAKVDPETTTTWATEFKNEPIRNECLRRSMWEWTMADGDAALAWSPCTEYKGTR